MSNKINVLLVLLGLCSVLYSCEKSNLAENKETFRTEGEQVSNCIFDLMLEAATNPTIVKCMNDEAIDSYNAGLDESVYIEEILTSDRPSVKSNTSSFILKDYILNNIHTNKTKSSEDITIVINDVEIYWPYAEDWDGYTQPVIVINSNDNNQFIEDDKTYAYKLTKEGADNNIETLIVDEEYAMKYPVWVINKSDVALQDIINLKYGNYDQTNYIPRTKSSDMVCELNATTITSIIQHDAWVNGASDYQIYWFHEDCNEPDSIKVNTSGQIKLSRKEIRNGTPREITFTGNFDWSKEQRYNRLKIIEVDPSGNKEIPIKLSATIKGVEVALETKITINDNDEMIMDYNIQRQAMFTEDTYVDDKHYQKAFNGNGVTLQTVITCSKKLEEV